MQGRVVQLEPVVQLVLLDSQGSVVHRVCQVSLALPVLSDHQDLRVLVVRMGCLVTRVR